jgi:hypothetical protein
VAPRGREPTGDPGPGDDPVGPDPDEDTTPPAPRPRPRITETGPMLPEDLGRPPGATLDLTRNVRGPLGLDPAQVTHGMNPLLGRLGACAEATTDDQGHGPRGRVTVRLRVRPSGVPAAARVMGSGGRPEFIACVRRVVASARFPAFEGPDVFATWGFEIDL